MSYRGAPSVYLMNSTDEVDSDSSDVANSAMGMMEASDAPAKMKRSAKSRRGETRNKQQTDKNSFRVMDDSTAQRLRIKYQEKVDHTKYELVAAFCVEGGIIQSYYVFRTRVSFELTERRRRLLARYYRPGRQEVVLYVNNAEFEHYMPVGYYKLKPPPPPPKEHSSAPPWIRFGRKK